MEHIIRAAAVVNRVKSASPAICTGALIPLIDNACDHQADLILVPLYALSGAGCARLLSVPSFQDKIEEQLGRLSRRYAEKNCAIVIGINETTSAVLYRGDVFQGTSEELSFLCSDAAVCLHSLSFSELLLSCGELADEGADICLLPTCHPVKAGDISRATDILQMSSHALGSALIFANGGCGETSSPYLYKSYCGAVEDGQMLAFSQNGDNGHMVLCDLDLDIIRSRKRKHNIPACRKDFLFSFSANEHSRLLRPLPIDPYLPKEADKEAAYLDEIFELQVKSLSDRMANSGISKLVLGISGGLDSTLAFLVAAAALDRLSLSRDHLLGITMPGFGTTGRTYVNAVSLIKAVGAEFREIHIGDSVIRHFEDIGHAPDNTNITYENAQARERAQILLDVANDVRGLVVGTGDLSEEALGWCTFAGDHIANYNVNVCVTKTMIRKIISRLVEEERFPDANEALADILNSPVSPELLPPDENGLIVQKTEEILGPYELHDFFLYYFVKYGMSPAKIFAYARRAFDDIAPEFILEKCKLFFRRLFGGQFKRSCSPDSAAITEINLSGAEFYLPSDCSPAEFLEELDRINPDEE